jgi:hypothetical protein
MRGTTLAFTVALGVALAGVVAGCGENPVPDNPTYSRNIKPLLEAHCTRCHGAGGMKNADPYIGPVTPPGAMTATITTPHSDFTKMADLMLWSGAFSMWLDAPMPPPPADPLTGWERELLLKWCAAPNFN